MTGEFIISAGLLMLLVSTICICWCTALLVRYLPLFWEAVCMYMTVALRHRKHEVCCCKDKNNAEKK